MDAMILSAGLGTRMRPLTERTPKALLKAGSYRLIEYHLMNLAKAGFKNVVINTSYLAQMFESTLGHGERYGVNITYSHEGAKPLETGGGIRRALPLIGSDPFLIVNADIWTDFQFDNATCDENNDGCLIVVDNPPHHPNGDFRLTAGRLALPTDGRKEETVTYSGTAVLRKSMLADERDGVFPLYKIFQTTILRQRLQGRIHRGAWFDIGTPERLQSLDSMLQTRQRM